LERWKYLNYYLVFCVSLAVCGWFYEYLWLHFDLYKS
jgi:hypothetical protein